MYRAEATRTHHRRTSQWRGKWKKDREKAVEQAARWREKEPEALIFIATDSGEKMTLEELEQRQRQ